MIETVQEVVKMTAVRLVSDLEDVQRINLLVVWH